MGLEVFICAKYRCGETAVYLPRYIFHLGIRFTPDQNRRWPEDFVEEFDPCQRNIRRRLEKSRSGFPLVLPRSHPVCSLNAGHFPKRVNGRFISTLNAAVEHCSRGSLRERRSQHLRKTIQRIAFKTCNYSGARAELPD